MLFQRNAQMMRQRCICKDIGCFITPVRRTAGCWCCFPAHNAVGALPSWPPMLAGWSKPGKALYKRTVSGGVPTADGCTFTWLGL